MKEDITITQEQLNYFEELIEENKKLKEGVLRFERILKEFDKLGKPTYYNIEEFQHDLINSFINLHKKIFGNLKE
ncbi:MAG: hypothetical protein ACQEQF_12910 [Bacillota bacterium]